MTFRDAALSAVQAQNACNLSGVVKTLAGPVMDALWVQANDTGMGTRWVAEHPITRLYLYKICELSGLEANSLSQGYDVAYDACMRITQELAVG